MDLTLLAESAIKEFRQTEPERKLEYIVAKNMYVKRNVDLLKVMVKSLIDNTWKFTSIRRDARI